MSETSDKGLYRKFTVRRTDGTDAPGQKHDQCTYFVLDMDHDKHAIPALRAYAKSCKASHPHLARDLEAVCDGNNMMKQRVNL